MNMARVGPALLLAGAVFFAGATAAPPATPPACEKVKVAGGWCAAGKVGYVTGVEIRSHALFEALDAHGHDVDPASVTCEACRKAIPADGFCRGHRMGYVKGKAYLSPLTYQIARSKTIDPAALTCPDCRRHAQGIGWCEKDQVGIAGHLAFDDRQAFDEFQRAYEALLGAVELSARCETCAAAMVAEGYCPTHRLKYKDGKPVPAS